MRFLLTFIGTFIIWANLNAQVLNASYEILEQLPNTAMDKKEDVIEYISIYCQEFYTDSEKAAFDHYIAQNKFFKLKDKVDQIGKRYYEMTSTDPQVLELLKGGIQEFHRRAAERVYNEHLAELTLNKCPKCNGIARTPIAKQCRYCGYDWH